MDYVAKGSAHEWSDDADKNSSDDTAIHHVGTGIVRACVAGATPAYIKKA